MLVLRKKRIVLITICALFSIFTFMFTTAKQENQITKETVSLPVSRKNYSFRCRAWNSR